MNNHRPAGNTQTHRTNRSGTHTNAKCYNSIISRCETIQNHFSPFYEKEIDMDYRKGIESLLAKVTDQRVLRRVWMILDRAYNQQA